MSRQAKSNGSTRVVSSHGYEYIWEKRDGKWRLQHRLVMEAKLGRPLAPHEHVHHDNENTLDNSPDNLILTSPRKHKEHHRPERKPKKPKARCARDGCDTLIPASEGKKYCGEKCRFYATHVTVTCPHCERRFIAYRSKGRKFCSRACANAHRAGAI